MLLVSDRERERDDCKGAYTQSVHGMDAGSGGGTAGMIGPQSDIAVSPQWLLILS